MRVHLVFFLLIPHHLRKYIFSFYVLIDFLFYRMQLEYQYFTWSDCVYDLQNPVTGQFKVTW